MSVDILPPKFSQIPTAFTYPHLQQMKEARAPSPFVVHGRVKIDDANTKVNINNFDPNYIVYDPTSDTTYIRGRLLGKVSRIDIPLNYIDLENRVLTVVEYILYINY